MEKIDNKRNLKISYYYKKYKGGIYMFKFIAKIAEKYAKTTNTACGGVFWVFHQPKMPATLIKKD